MKSIFFTLLLISPAFAAWAYRASARPDSQPGAPSSFATNFTQPVPIEILEKGSAPKVIYLQATPKAPR